jgi:RimJ/RimL family protein N-acetyltransferase
MILQSERLQLKTLTPAMVTQKYVDWMNDHDVTQYTESRFQRHTMESIKEYVKGISGSNNDYFYGIYLCNEHIGNIKLHVNEHHNLGDIGIIIGDKQQWGKGYATEAIKTLTQHGFDKIGLHKIIAGIYANNKGSIKAFEKAGYNEDGRHELTYLSNGEYVDEIIMSSLLDFKVNDFKRVE